MATINDLPNELLLHIFSYLRGRLKTASCVCRRWDALIVPDLRLLLWRDDDDRAAHWATTFRNLFRRSWRQYERVSFSFGIYSDLGDRTRLWTLERFPYAREVFLVFKENNLMRLLMYLDALRPNVQRLMISFTGSLDCGPYVEHKEKKRVSSKAPNLRHVLFVHLKESALRPVCNWFQRNAPNIESLDFWYSQPADFIQLYAGQLRELRLMFLFYKGESINHIKCPKLIWFGLIYEKDIIPNELDSFIQNAPELRHFELRSDSPCQDAVRALVNLPNLEVLKLDPEKEVITFEEHDKFPALRILSVNCPITDVPQLPTAQKLIILQPTSDRFYPRMIFRAPNLTCLHVEKDTFLNNESIVSICTGLPQLTDLRLKIHRTVPITVKAFVSIHLLHKLQRFYICFADVSQHKCLGAWIKRLKAPTVTIVSEQCFATLPLKSFNLLLANSRFRLLTLCSIAVKDLHRNGGAASVRREVAKVRPDMQFLYLDPNELIFF